MKKTLYLFVLVTLIIFMVSLSSYAVGSGVYSGKNIALGHKTRTVDYVAGRGHYGGRRGHYGGRRGHYAGRYGYYKGPRYYWGGSIVIGPWLYPWYPYPYGYYTAPPSYVQPPQVYVQPQQPQQSYWYYCQDPKGYYPYVQSCPGGWMKVLPQTPPPKQ